MPFSRGAVHAFLEVAADNGAARALYQACGYSEAGLRSAYYPRVDAPAADGVVPTVGPLTIDGTPFPISPDSGDGLQDFSDALAQSFEDFITVSWTVEMPGRVRETNATDEEGSVLTWNLGLSEISEGSDELFARSVVSKNAAGSCNL